MPKIITQEEIDNTVNAYFAFDGNIREVADELGVCPITVYNHLKLGGLPADNRYRGWENALEYCLLHPELHGLSRFELAKKDWGL